MKTISEKLFEMKRHDVWSDFVTQGLGSVGITQEIRDLAQPVIDKGKSLLPQGGAIPNPSVQDSNFSFPEITDERFTFMNQILQPKIAGIPVVILGMGALLIFSLARK
jgi:hypothetical protein